MRFADTNVLLYAISTDPREEQKAAVATSLLDGGDIVLSVQVLQEFYVQATRLSRRDRLDGSVAAELVATFQRFPVVPVTPQTVTAAIATHRRYDISYWDAAILEAARSAGCDVVLSEDLSDTVDYGGIRVENPFT